MVEAVKNGQFERQAPSEFRRSVSSQNQFQLPALLVREVGFKSDRLNPISGAMVAWYYHEGQDKAVLSTDTVDRSSLEPVGVSGLSEVSNEDLESGVVTGARVTIISDLPDQLHELLTRGEVVLKPLYSSEYSRLKSTCVSVYPAAEYDRGELPNVSRERAEREAEGSGERTTEVVDVNRHANVV